MRYDGTPSILVLADTEAGRAESVAIVEGALGGTARSASIADAAERLDDAVSAGAVFVDVRQDSGAALDRLLDRLDLAARHDRRASVVCIPPALIDITGARVAHRDVALLVDATLLERSGAISLAARIDRPVSPMLGEERGAPGQLLRLSEEVGRIARTLAALSVVPEPRPPGPMADRSVAVEPPAAAVVRAAIRARRLREQFFAAELFADPAWDMLLDLMAARLEGCPVAVSSLCIAGPCRRRPRCAG